MNLFRRRSIADLQAEVLTDQSLKRALGPVNLTALGIGAIIGAGIFVLTGQAAAKYAGPAIVYSFILAGIACTFAGLCYAVKGSVNSNVVFDGVGQVWVRCRAWRGS